MGGFHFLLVLRALHSVSSLRTFFGTHLWESPPSGGGGSPIFCRWFDFRSASPKGSPCSAPFICPVGAFRAFGAVCSRLRSSLIELSYSRPSSLHHAPREGGRVQPVRTLVERGAVVNRFAICLVYLFRPQ